MAQQRISTKQLYGKRVIDGSKGKRIGKVRHFVFHPSERKIVGFTVKRPDAALMFHRKDAFVAFDAFQLKDGEIVANGEVPVAGKSALKELGLDWDSCVLWLGMPVMTQNGTLLGYADTAEFFLDTGEVSKITVENGAANDVIVGKLAVPASLIRGFRRGKGEALVHMDEEDPEQAEDEQKTLGCILVDDKALELEVQGGAAAAAGKATAVVTDKAKKGASKAKAAVDEQREKAKPVAKKAAEKTEEAVNAGAFAVGRQLGRASGMFSAFKEEFDKAVNDDEDEEGQSGDANSRNRR